MSNTFINFPKDYAKQGGITGHEVLRVVSSLSTKATGGTDHRCTREGVRAGGLRDGSEGLLGVRGRSYPLVQEQASGTEGADGSILSRRTNEDHWLRVFILKLTEFNRRGARIQRTKRI